ncbi:HAD family hydrolase [Sphingobacterium hungaricum]|uniref:phosphoglycolate phosphatase n=1 Tax=Sphingobacterium hungaricum TaxID=2082723 RepID=A0A928V094_9SPHI|nr:HAD family phosphatase [Sphingobacterium hungaricum]MBE8713779.1 hypothetical protein [Sphingobacterium hungaricum]
MSTTKAVLFDLDGTLIDSELFYFSSWSPILKREFAIEIDFKDWLNIFAGHTLDHNISMLKDRWYVDVNRDFLWAETRKSYADADMKTIQLMPFAKEILQFLKNEGKQIGLVTSSYKSTVDTVLGHHQLLGYFDFFVTREDVESPKPDPEPYLKAIHKLNLPKDSIVAVEDTSTGFASATAAGIACFVVSVQESQQDRLSGKTEILSSLKDLLKTI